MKSLLKKLIIARLQVLPPGINISLGSEGKYSKTELIEHVKKGDKIGQKITQVHLSFLQSLKTGIFYEQDSSGHQA